MACLPTEMDQFVPTEVNLSLIATGSKVLRYELPLNPITKEFGEKKPSAMSRIIPVNQFYIL